MTDKDRKEQRKLHEDTDQQPTATDRNLLEYDPEKAKDLIDVDEATKRASQVNPPDQTDPQRSDEGVPPDQENTSRGFTTGRGMQGGSANRRKR